MTDAGVSPFTIEGHWFVGHGTPGPGLIPFRLDGRVHTFEEVGFLADCVSYDHDTPTVVRPVADSRAARRPPIEPLFPYRSRQNEALGYFTSVESTLGEASDLRVGNGAPVLRYHEFPSLRRLHKRFAGVEEALSLYAMATRQVEVISEYLCLYRVLEWPRRDNGVAYAADHLRTIRSHNFGKLWSHRYRSETRRNIFTVYRARAVRRVDDLRARLKTDLAVAQHLYGIRNSIAHGKSKFVVDRPSELSEIGKDLVVVKLLARLVVERVV